MFTCMCLCVCLCVLCVFLIYSVYAYVACCVVLVLLCILLCCCVYTGTCTMYDCLVTWCVGVSVDAGSRSEVNAAFLCCGRDPQHCSVTALSL